MFEGLQRVWETFFNLDLIGQTLPTLLRVGLPNTLLLAVAFGSVTVLVAQWAEGHSLGLLHTFDLTGPVRLLLALVLLDGWMYLWHRANHTVPFLWRFHRMHQSCCSIVRGVCTRRRRILFHRLARCRACWKGWG